MEEEIKKWNPINYNGFIIFEPKYPVKIDGKIYTYTLSEDKKTGLWRDWIQEIRKIEDSNEYKKYVTKFIDEIESTPKAVYTTAKYIISKYGKDMYKKYYIQRKRIIDFLTKWKYGNKIFIVPMMKGWDKMVDEFGDPTIEPEPDNIYNMEEEIKKWNTINYGGFIVFEPKYPVKIDGKIYTYSDYKKPELLDDYMKEKRKIEDSNEYKKYVTKLRDEMESTKKLKKIKHSKNSFKLMDKADGKAVYTTAKYIISQYGKDMYKKYYIQRKRLIDFYKKWKYGSKDFIVPMMKGWDKMVDEFGDPTIEPEIFNYDNDLKNIKIFCLEKKIKYLDELSSAAKLYFLNKSKQFKDQDIAKIVINHFEPKS